MWSFGSLWNLADFDTRSNFHAVAGWDQFLSPLATALSGSITSQTLSHLYYYQSSDTHSFISITQNLTPMLISITDNLTPVLLLIIRHSQSCININQRHSHTCIIINQRHSHTYIDINHQALSHLYYFQSNQPRFTISLSLFTHHIIS